MCIYTTYISTLSRPARYLERFAHFFSEPVFVRRCFEALNAEQRPELLGAARAMQELFEVYRGEKGIEQELLVDYCYEARRSRRFRGVSGDFIRFYQIFNCFRCSWT